MTNIIEISRRLRAAGADPKLADAIAESQAELSESNRLQKLEADVAVLKWMAGFNLALTLLVLGKLFLK